MLNRYTIALCVKYLFDNINKINTDNDYQKCLDYISSINTVLPDNMNDTINSLYTDILLENKNIDLDTQINIVKGYFNKLEKYINNINDRNISNRICLMNIEIEIMFKRLKEKRMIRTIRKGYK